MKYSLSNTSTTSEIVEIVVPQVDNEQLIIPIEVMYPDDYFFTETPTF